MDDYISRKVAIQASELVIDRDMSGENAVVNAMIAWNEYIKGLPSADVQTVVRCKDCKHWNDAPAYDGFNSCEMDALIRHESFFCANGERKDGKQ